MDMKTTLHRTDHGCRGFTLVELLVVMVIASLAMALVLPSLSGARTRLELNSATRQLSAALRHARSQAIARHADVALVLNVEDRSYRYSDEPARYALPDTLNLKLLTSQSELVGSDSGAIRFFPDGSSTGGRIVLLADGTDQAIDVNWLTGRISIND